MKSTALLLLTARATTHLLMWPSTTSNKQLPALPARYPDILGVYQTDRGQQRQQQGRRMPVAPLHQLLARTTSRSATAKTTTTTTTTAAAPPPPPPPRSTPTGPRLAGRVSAEYWIDTWERTPLHGVYTVDRVIPPSLCRCIIQEAASQDFATNRHKHFPTVDIPLTKLPNSWIRFEPILEMDIYPLLKNLYQLNEPRFNVVDMFVVRYKTGQQVELGVHRDGSIISFNILLNSSVDFCGGGTKFPGLKNLTIRGSKGAAIIHCGKLKHSGVRITKGERMLLVGFINVVDDKTILPVLSRYPLRSYSRDDDYLRGLWIGRRPIAVLRRHSAKKRRGSSSNSNSNNKIRESSPPGKEEGGGGGAGGGRHDDHHESRHNHNNKTSSGLLTCLSRFGCSSTTDSFSSN